MTEVDVELEDWSRGAPAEFTADPLWNLLCFRESLFFLSLAREDALALEARPAFRDVSTQLLRCSGSIPANIAEGYARNSNSDRVRFLVYALGSARETMVWYDGVRGAVDNAIVAARLRRLSRIVRLLTGLLRRVRDKTRARFDPW